MSRRVALSYFGNQENYSAKNCISITPPQHCMSQYHLVIRLKGQWAESKDFVHSQNTLFDSSVTISEYLKVGMIFCSKQMGLLL